MTAFGGGGFLHKLGSAAVKEGQGGECIDSLSGRFPLAQMTASRPTESPRDTAR